MLDPVIQIVITLAFATFFATACIHKMRAPAVFVDTLREYRLLPQSFVATAACIVVVSECALVPGVLWPGTRVLAAVIGAALLLVYGAAIGINILRGRRELDCGCSLQPRRVGTWMVVRNVLLAATLLTLLAPVARRPLELTDVFTVVAVLLVATLLYASTDLLLGQTKAHASSPEYQ